MTHSQLMHRAAFKPLAGAETSTVTKTARGSGNCGHRDEDGSLRSACAGSGITTHTGRPFCFRTSARREHPTYGCSGRLLLWRELTWPRP